MNKNEAALKKAKWLAYCLSIGWDKKDLDGLSKTWDRFYGESGNKREIPLQESSQPSTGMREALRPLAELDLIGVTGDIVYQRNNSQITVNDVLTARKALFHSPENECKWSDSDVKKFLEDYRVANMDCYLNPVIWFDKLNDEK